MGSKIYYSPEKYGLEKLFEIDYSTGCYEFDYRVVWRRLSDGQLLSGRDSGCSCPSPFEMTGVSDLQEVNSTGWLREEIEKESADGLSGSSAAECAKFIEDIEKLLMARNQGKGG